MLCNIVSIFSLAKLPKKLFNCNSIDNLLSILAQHQKKKTNPKGIRHESKRNPARIQKEDVTNPKGKGGRKTPKHQGGCFGGYCVYFLVINSR
jgi:hypothetical protein